VHYTQADLHSLNKDIIERDRRIADLERLIHHVRRKGRSVEAAQQLLETMLVTQRLSIVHRDMIATLLTARTRSG
jgi:hypothetical protein